MKLPLSYLPYYLIRRLGNYFLKDIIVSLKKSWFCNSNNAGQRTSQGYITAGCPSESNMRWSFLIFISDIMLSEISDLLWILKYSQLQSLRSFYTFERYKTWKMFKRRRGCLVNPVTWHLGPISWHCSLGPTKSLWLNLVDGN